MAPTDAVGDDVVEHVIGFLTPDDLLAVIRVNAYWRLVGQRDATWRAFIAARWRVERPERLQRACGTESLYELYRYLDRNRYLPRGRYTTKQQIIWGRSRQEGADVWLTVAHRPDCRVLAAGATAFIQLRVAIQNLREQPLAVDLGDIRVRMKNGYMGKVLGADATGAGHATLAPKLLAFNGSSELAAVRSRDALHSVSLAMFDFAVVSVNVECHACEFEAEFLEGCSALWLPVRRIGRCSDLTTCRCALIPDSYHRGSIRVPIVDESVVWRHYTSISGRFMVLDCRSSWDDFTSDASMYLFKAPPPPTSAVRKTSIA
ncbi:hypothetical protein PybrP1_012978 [[Pythium] brassicae (nom. inval.)]|nr:hypothetical protein PybrP1_012978 [[Pythium] brassicae (nom. inval.)]